MKALRIPLVALLIILPLFIHAKACSFYAHPRMNAKEKKMWRRAENHYTYSEYDLAVPYYDDLLRLHPENYLLNFHEGICLYYSTTSRPLSVYYLQKAIQLTKRDTDPDLLIHMGWAYLAVNNFKDAKYYFEAFQKKDVGNRNKDLLERLLANCENGEKFWSEQSRTRIFNLGPAINSIYPDYSPVFTPDFSKMLFTSRREGTTGGKRDGGNGYFEDVYFSKRLDSSWAEASRYDSTYTAKRFTNLRLFFGQSENVKEINTAHHDGSICISPDGQKFYVYRAEDIWETQLNGSQWEKPKKLDQSIDRPADFEPSAFFSKDGTTLFFVSDRKDGMGGKDIYSCTKTTDGTWSEPSNMGSGINSKWNEDSPYLTDDGNTLYFSSEGHNSMGGYDVFKCHKTADGKWSEPENLGAPVNNGDDDIYFVPDEKNHRAFYSTLNRNGLGSFDIYEVRFFPEIQPLAKIRINATENSSEKIAVRLKEISGKSDTTFYVLNHDSLIYAYNPATKYILSVNGGGFQPFSNDTVYFKPSLNSDFALQQLNLSRFSDSVHTGESLEMDNYLFDIDALFDSTKIYDFENLIGNRKIALESISGINSISVPSTETKITDTHFLNEPLTENNPGIVYFDFDKSGIRPDMIKTVDDIAVWLKNNQDQKVEIAGYTDSKGADSYNVALSQKRAATVKNYLSEKGINEEQLVIKANGESSPAAENNLPNGNDNPAGRAMNRRVEIHLLR